MTESSPEDLLSAFFGPGNDLHIRDRDIVYAEGGSPIPAEFQSWLDPWIQDLIDGDVGTILPRKRGDQIRWYAMAFNDRQLRSFREELHSFIGPSYADWDGQLAEMDPADPIEAAVSDRTKGRVFVFLVGTGVAGREFRDAMTLMGQVRRQRPARVRADHRPTGSLLRDFDVAIQDRDDRTAAEVIDLLRSEGRLEADNLAFLEVRRLAAGRRWGTLLEAEFMPTLLEARRPLLVTQDLIRAVYEEKLSQFEVAHAPQEAIEFFGKSVLPAYGRLFRSWSGMRDPAVLKSFMLLAAASDPPRTSLRDDILNSPGAETVDDRYLREIASLVGSPSTGPTLAEAFIVGDFDLAFILAQQHSPGAERTRWLVDSAYELQTLSSARIALEAFGSLGEQDKSIVLGFRRTQNAIGELRRLGGGTSDTPAGDWVEWVGYVCETPYWAEAREVAEAGLIEWIPGSVDGERGILLRMSEAIAGCGDEGAWETFVNTMPLMIEWIRDCPEGVDGLAEIADTLMTVLSLAGQFGSQELGVILDLADLMLGSGLDEEQYVGLGDYLLGVWNDEGVASYERLDWGLEAVDLLVRYPSPRSAIPEDLWGAVASAAHRYRRRLRLDDYRVIWLDQLASELDQEAQFEDLIRSQIEMQDQEDIGPGIVATVDIKVGLYTLTSAVARRCKSLLAVAYPAMTVSVSDDKVCTERLRAMARNSDVMVVATSSASHSATDCVADHRSPTASTLFATGKGSSSMMRALLEWLEERS